MKMEQPYGRRIVKNKRKLRSINATFFSAGRTVSLSVNVRVCVE